MEGGLVVDFEAPACDGLWAGLRQRLVHAARKHIRRAKEGFKVLAIPETREVLVHWVDLVGWEQLLRVPAAVTPALHRLQLARDRLCVLVALCVSFAPFLVQRDLAPLCPVLLDGELNEDLAVDLLLLVLLPPGSTALKLRFSSMAWGAFAT